MSSLEGHVGKLAATVTAQSKTIMSQGRALASMKEEMNMMKKMAAKHFPPSVKKVGRLVMPDGIIGHLTKECEGNVHDRKIIELITGSFARETSPGFGSLTNVADLEAASMFYTGYCSSLHNIRQTRTNCICYDFKDRKIVPTHCIQILMVPVGNI
jgi:hypothetical protein